jgi:membrane protein insertase Oxa1/YidC/SpoIIIJ
MYLAAILLAIVAAIAQYYQSKSLMIDEKDSRKLKDIFKAAASGEQADQAEMTAAVSKGMLIFMPFMTFIFSISIPSALSLYVVTSSVVGYFQQRSVLKEDVEDMAKISRDQPIDDIPEAEVIEESPKKPKNKKQAKSKKKRRR